MILFNIGIIIITFIIIGLDMLKKINLIHKSFLSLFLILIPHIILIIYYFFNYKGSNTFLISSKYAVIFSISLLFFYIWIKINLFSNIKEDINKRRVKILFSGIKIILYGLYTSIIQIIFYGCIYIYIHKREHHINNKILISDIIITILAMITLIANGIIRILCTSKRITTKKRLTVAWTIWIPIVNLFTIIYAYRIARDEYEHEIYKADLDKIKPESEICKTKYPIVLIHGLGFRDFKYLNYWGRIPRELIKNGADVHYGNQEAFGTVECNANDIRDKIIHVLKETGSEKVNIIAHSKGGLDARYAISKLGMGKYVASVTMISSPNRGVKFVDYACNLPDKFYRSVAKIFDKYFLVLGDKKPDFYSATRMFSTYESRKFNEEVKDVRGVYYQSYASVMSNMFSDNILSIPYLLVKLTEGSDNDGLVSVESAKWGKFKGILRNDSKGRGISHGDTVDFHRDDYNGFDVVKKYIEIVSDLKNMGY